MKKVLLLNASHSEIPLIEELHKLGYYVVTTGNRPDYPGHKLADSYIKADYSDKDALLKICQDEHMDGIVSNAFDLGLVATSYVAEQMGWKGHDTYQNTLTLHQKDLFKQLCIDLDIPSPRSTHFNDEQSAMDFIRGIEYPIIVKAVDQASGIGISRADNEEEAVAAIKNSFDKSKEKRIVIEPFIVGKQESINAFVVNGKVLTAVTCDSYSPINPYLIQTETLLSENYDNLKEVLFGIIEKLFAELKLVDGLITIQYLVKDGKPYVIEMMRRCLGNRYLLCCEAKNGFPWHKALVMSELGMDISKLEFGQPVGKYVGHHAIMARSNGTFHSYTIPEEIMKHVFKQFKFFEDGEEITNYMSQRLGYIYYSYETREELDYAAKHFNDLIKIEMDKAE